jgi:hypothetical protein
MIGPTEVKRLKNGAAGRPGSSRDEVSEIENPSSVFYGNHYLIASGQHSDRKTTKSAPIVTVSVRMAIPSKGLLTVLPAALTPV